MIENKKEIGTFYITILLECLQFLPAMRICQNVMSQISKETINFPVHLCE